MTRTVATIEARMTSTRLPGKVLLPAAGRPLLEHMIHRLTQAGEIDEIVVATTTDRASDPIADLATELGVGVYRGSEHDVLGRVLEAASSVGADVIVETTGDCPLIDPAIVDQVIRRHRQGDVDYCSNTLERTYPRGMDVQVFGTAVLADVDSRTTDPVDREHVSLYIYEHPELYRLANVASGHREWGDVRLTVDTPEDYALVSEVLERLQNSETGSSLADIMALLEADPQLAAVNSGVEQKRVR